MALDTADAALKRGCMDFEPNRYADQRMVVRTEVVLAVVFIALGIAGAIALAAIYPSLIMRH